MTRLSYLLYCWVTAVRYHAPRRLTKAGLLVAGGALLAGAIGSDLDQSIAFQTFALMFCLLWVAVAWTPFFRGYFSLARALPRLASVGELFKYVVGGPESVRSSSLRGLELLEDLADPRPGYREFAKLIRPTANWRAFSDGDARPRLEQRDAIVSPGRLPDLRPKGLARAEIQLVPLRRGSLRFCGMTVARADPLGLARSFVRVAAPQRVLVLPQRHAVPLTAFPGMRRYQPGATTLASAIGQSEEFVSVREYRPGDAFRQIHWRSWARAGRPMAKQCQDESAVRHGLLLDTFARQGLEGLFEEAVSVAASFACTGPGQESMLDLLFVGGEAFSGSIGQSSSDSQRLLEVLAARAAEPDAVPGGDAGVVAGTYPGPGQLHLRFFELGQRQARASATTAE